MALFTPLLQLSAATAKLEAAAIAGLLLVDEQHYRARPRLRGVIEAGVHPIKYACRAPFSWVDVVLVLQKGYGCCADLAPAVAGEARARGGVWRHVYVAEVDPLLTHVYCGDGRGAFFDPALELGMPLPTGLSQRGLQDFYRSGVKCPLA